MDWWSAIIYCSLFCYFTKTYVWSGYITWTLYETLSELLCDTECYIFFGFIYWTAQMNSLNCLKGLMNYLNQNALSTHFDWCYEGSGIEFHSTSLSANNTRSLDFGISFYHPICIFSFPLMTILSTHEQFCTNYSRYICLLRSLQTKHYNNVNNSIMLDILQLQKRSQWEIAVCVSYSNSKKQRN